MSFPATARYRVGTADETGPALVQELVNTKAAGGRPDLLADLDAARAWAAEVDPALTVTDRDLPRLRVLRSAFAAALAGTALTGTALTGTAARGIPAGTLSLRFEDGVVTATPKGRDAAGWFTSALLAEAYQAQRDGSWRRLKLCRKPACAVAFYDHSRNNAGVWHDVRACGNAANLRASRARRRTGA
jgi:hypothetical protein